MEAGQCMSETPLKINLHAGRERKGKEGGRRRRRRKGNQPFKRGDRRERVSVSMELKLRNVFKDSPCSDRARPLLRHSGHWCQRCPGGSTSVHSSTYLSAHIFFNPPFLYAISEEGKSCAIFLERRYDCADMQIGMSVSVMP